MLYRGALTASMVNGIGDLVSAAINTITVDTLYCVVPQGWYRICTWAGEKEVSLPKHLTARPPLDATEERQVRKLTHSVHAPADWIFHAKMVAAS